MGLLQRRVRRRRRAFTLVELVAVMAANTALITLAVVTLASLHRTDRNLRDHAEQQQQLADLCGRLRADLRAARHAAWDEKAESLKLTTSASAAIEYHAAPGRWERRQVAAPSDGGATAAPTSLKVPQRLECIVSPSEADAGKLMELRLEIPPRANALNTPAAIHRLVVQVGRDSALLQP